MIEDILARLQGVTNHGNYWKSRCPGHDDKHSSLSISEGDLGVLLKCHAGCSYEQIMAALGLEPRDGFNEDNSAPQEPEAVYTYVDEQGDPLFEVVRFPGKQFRQRKPDGSWGVKDVRRVLYGLPEVLARAQERAWLFVCEGEKDVEAIRKAGGVATCNMGGAGSWKDVYSEQLRGAHVRIVVDKDEPGRKHAAEVMTSLVPYAAKVQLVEAREGKDAYDHLRAGYDLESFVQLGQTSPSGYRRLDLFQGIPATDWVIEDFLVAGEVTVGAGESGIGKSFLSMAAALAVAGGEPSFLGLTVRKHGPVLYVDEENTVHLVLQRLHALGMEDAHRQNLVYYAYAGVDLKREPERLRADVDEIKPVLVVIDSLSRVLLGVDENSNTEMSLHFRQSLIPLARDTGAAVFLVHHTTGTGRPRGASAIKAAADQVLSVVAGEEEGEIDIYPSKPRRRTARLKATIDGDLENGWIRVKRPGPSWA